MQMHQLQINETPNPKINEPKLKSGMWKRQFLNRFPFQLDRLRFNTWWHNFRSKLFILKIFDKAFSRYVKIKRLNLSY